jgi:hypothetical protein
MSLQWLARLALCLLLLAGCADPAGERSPSPAAGQGLNVALPEGWQASEEPRPYGVEDLYALVDGQADSYYAYGFERVTVLGYLDPQGNPVRVEVWQLGSPAGAFGLYTTFRSGSLRAVGNEGDGSPGRRIDFWSDRFFVRLVAGQPLPDEELLALAQALAASLPAGGTEPALLNRLPPDGLQERATLFFHQEISIQDRLWLGGQNHLGLGPDTEGLLATYDLAGQRAHLLLVRYPHAEAARAGLQGLEAAPVEGLVAARAHGDLLAGVFGAVSAQAAERLLARALGSGQAGRAQIP